MQNKPFSQSCEKNKNPIFSVLAPQLKKLSHVVEIGSGMGQHAQFFTQQLPHLTWQTTDQGEYLGPLTEVIEAENAERLPKPLKLDVTQSPWPIKDCECIYTANTLHIMSLDNVEMFFDGVGKALVENGHLYIYGPFNYEGQYTSPSNERFDQWLINQHPLSAIRDIEKIIELANKNNIQLVDDHEMPANNRLLCFIKTQ